MTTLDKQAAFSDFLSIFRPLSQPLLPVLLLLSGCISHGLPEPVSGFVESDSRLNKVVVPETVALIRSKTSTPEFIPLTSTYFEHGKQQLVDEAVIDLLAKEGFRVAEVKKEDLAELATTTPLSAIIEVELLSLRANAWDLLVTRKLSVSADAVIRFYNPNVLKTFEATFEPVQSERIEIADYSFLTQAQGPRISSFIESFLKKNLDPQIQQIRKRPKLRNSNTDNDGKFM